MALINSHTTIALCLGVFLLVAIAACRWQQSKAMKQRIIRMMLTFGIDEATASRANALPGIDMNAVRSRCRRCPSPKTCERWLNGETLPGNEFCANARYFTAVRQARECRLRYAPGHRPGRRLDA